MDEITIISMVATAGFGVLSLHLNGKYQKFKKVLNNLVDMIEDDKITQEELITFVKSVKELIHYV
uniref:Uncharacterized protein n=1 Tax=viral metagenome TaxID=1070528 RepID=A0A6M3LTU0_9ZZZZ